MATRKFPKKSNENFSLDVSFDGVIQTSIRSALVIEYIKYIIYQRQQIPLPFDQIKGDTEIELEVSDNTSHLRGKQTVSNRYLHAQTSLRL